MKLSFVRSEFIEAISSNQAAFRLNLDDSTAARLADYFDLVGEHNPLLHLVGPCSPSEFAVRHILESLTLLEYLPAGAKVADVGAGAGLPSIPCLLAREDLGAILIESKQKKAKFLHDVINELNLNTRAKIVDRQFEETDPTDCGFVTCRALDKFTDKLPRLLKWSGMRRKLFFGGPNLRSALIKHRLVFEEKLLPMSEQRFLFLLGR